MAAAITKGYTFGATELVTSTKLHSLIDSATISGILNTEMANAFLTSLTTVAGGISWYGVRNDLLTSLPSAAGKLPKQNWFNYAALNTNTSVPDVSLYTSMKIYYSTYGSIASFTNARLGQTFIIMAGQASMPGFADAGNFILDGDWIPAKANDNITFIWDGTNFVEIARVGV